MEYHDLGACVLARVPYDCRECVDLTAADAASGFDGEIGGLRGYQGVSNGWREVRFDLTSWECGSIDLFLDLYLAGEVTTRPGWTIDDLSVEYFSRQVIGSFVAGPAYFGSIVPGNDGVADCPTGPASVRLSAWDGNLNMVTGLELQVAALGTGDILFFGADQGATLLDQEAGSATILLAGSNAQIGRASGRGRV